MGGVYSIDGVIPVVDPSAFVHPDAVLIGDVRIGPNCYIGPHASLRGDMGRIEVGAGSNIQDSCVLHCFPGRATELALDAHVGHAAILHGCRIGSGVLVGINAVVMDGVDVGDRAFIAAHSFVKTGLVVPAGTLASGSPAQVVRELTEDEMAWKANGTIIYQELARRSLMTMERCDPLPAVDGERRLGVDRERARPLQEYRAATRNGS
jgi:phenylacetic acid degradation protein